MSSDRFHRLQALFDAASELPLGEQSTFLQEACGDDRNLRLELQSLLDIHQGGSPLLKSDILGWPMGLAEGDSVGPYRVVREIGRGGMGVVYLAEDPRLHRQVALKALGPALQSDDKQQARFRREAAMAASLSHPGIAAVYALEEWNSGQYIVGEYVPGVTLAEEFDRGALDPDSILDVGIQLAAAVSAAHNKGVLHRDLKPSNVIRTPDGRLKILDFGLAIAFAPAGDAPTRLTEAGTLLGTPAYMAPEQLRGESADFRSDVFALGIVLCEGATGRHPFAGTTVAVTMAAILADAPQGLESLRDASPWLERIIRRCLHKDPQQRFASATELHAELAQLQKEGLRAAPHLPPGPVGRRVSLRWWFFHQAAVVVSCALLTAALWQVSVWVPSLFTRLTFIGGLAVASIILTLRTHLVATARYNSAAVFRELSRVMPWARRADWSFSLILAATALFIAAERRLVAAFLLGFAVAYVIVFVFTEPATRAAVFEDESPKP